MWAIGKLAPASVSIPNRSAGFTLIEALVTLAVSALVVSVCFPAIEKMLDFWRFRQASAAVGLAIEQVRADALRSGVATRFSVAPDGLTYVTARAGATPLPANVRFERGGIVFSFFPDGSARGGRLHLISAGRGRWFSVSSDLGVLEIAQ